MRRVVISLGVGRFYPKQVDRLEDSLKKLAPNDHWRLYREYPEGCPRHREVPYGFKPWLVKQAQADGYDSALWLDSKVWLHHSLEPLWAEIEAEGHAVLEDGWNCGQWTTDIALKNLAITRDEAWGIPQLYACVMGFHFANPRTVAFLDEWLRLSQDGETFQGPWRFPEYAGKPLPSAKDKVVFGHRHDQTAASILVWKMGMKMLPMGGKWFTAEPRNLNCESILLAHGGDGPLIADDGTRIA